MFDGKKVYGIFKKSFYVQLKEHLDAMSAVLIENPKILIM